MTDYQRIEAALTYAQAHFRAQPDLDELAAQAHWSPFHFQRKFREWAGVSPKKFLQFLSLEYAKPLLRQHASVAEAAHEAGFSGTGRLHDLFVTLEAMTPGDYRHGGAALTIRYSFGDSPFGRYLVAATASGICKLAFVEADEIALAELRQEWPCATFIAEHTASHAQAARFFARDFGAADRLHLHLNGTPFQLKIWESLLRIPEGHLRTYAQVAATAQSQAVRAVGTAIGANPVGYLIPCHRVIRQTGELGQYRWGSSRKAALLGSGAHAGLAGATNCARIGWEAARAARTFVASLPTIASCMHQLSEPAILYFGTPVVLISTLNEDGTPNLAPMSSVFWLGWRGMLGLAAPSQTTQNLLRTGQCVLNLPSESLVGAVNRLALTTGSTPVPAGKQQKGYRTERDKFGLAGLTPVPAHTVAPPRVAECPVQLEAVLEAAHGIAEADEAVRGRLLSLEVRIQRVHLDDAILLAGQPNRVDPDKWRPLLMSFQQFYGLGPRLHDSRLATIPEELYRSADVDRARTSASHWPATPV